MLVALDSNVLIYAEGVDDEARQRIARDTIGHLNPAAIVIPVQAVGEMARILVRKAQRRLEDVEILAREWLDSYASMPTSVMTLRMALKLRTSHGLDMWDAVMVAAAAEAGCRLLLSEDMQDGFSWHGVTIINPFKAPIHPLLETALESNR